MNQATDRLDWLAARYVLGELDAAEAASFEERLADDETAAISVVNAVRLVDAVAQTQPAVVSRRLNGVHTQANRRRAGWNRPMAAIAACLAVAALPFIALRRPEAVREPADIVARWQEIPLEHVVGSGLQATLESQSVVRLPPWLVAAVAISAEGTAQP